MADITKIDGEDDPHRCQAVTAAGQCVNKAVEGGTNCLAHGGNKQVAARERASFRNYQLSKFQAKLARHSSSNFIKDLRDEIGILRMVLETRLERCQTDNDLIIQSGPISEMVMKIEKVVASCHKLEGSMGQLLDKQALLQYANQVITIISEELEDNPEVVTRIADKMIKEISNADV